jgi:hypothetical protein
MPCKPMQGEWQHAGQIFRFVQGKPWRGGSGAPGEQISLQESEAGAVRRQELVLIGPSLDTAKAVALLDECLLDASEMGQRGDVSAPAAQWWSAARSPMGDASFPAFEGSAEAAAQAAQEAVEAAAAAQAAKVKVATARWGGAAAAQVAEVAAAEQDSKAKAAAAYAAVLAEKAHPAIVSAARVAATSLPPPQQHQVLATPHAKSQPKRGSGGGCCSKPSTFD